MRKSIFFVQQKNFDLLSFVDNCIIYFYEYYTSMKNIRFSKKIIKNRIKAMKKLKE